MTFVLDAVCALGWSLSTGGARLTYWDSQRSKELEGSIEELTAAFASGAGVSIESADDVAWLWAGPEPWLTEGDFRISISRRGRSVTEAELNRLVVLWCVLARSVDLVAGYLCDEVALDHFFQRPWRGQIEPAAFNSWLAGRGWAAAVVWDPVRYDLSTKVGIQIDAGATSCRLYQPTWHKQPLETQLRAALQSAP